MNAEKLAKLQAQVRIGGKGTPRRKKKVVHKTETADDKKLQSALQKVKVTQIPGIETVNMFKDDGSVMHFNNPKVQASLSSNTFAVYGQSEDKLIMELLPGIIGEMGTESLSHIQKLAGDAILKTSENGGDKVSDDEVPDLVENFDEICKDEVPCCSNLDQKQTEFCEINATTEENETTNSDGGIEAPDTVENLEVNSQSDTKSLKDVKDEIKNDGISIESSICQNASTSIDEEEHPKPEDTVKDEEPITLENTPKIVEDVDESGDIETVNDGRDDKDCQL